MSMETSLYSLLRNRIIQDALPQEMNIASYVDMYNNSGASTIGSQEEIYNFIECGITYCRVENDVSAVPDDVERCN